MSIKPVTCSWATLETGPNTSHTSKSYYNSSSVCVFVCFLSPPRSFGRSSPNLVGVCRWTSHLPLRGSFSKRSTARWVNGSLSLSTILYMPQPHATQLQRRLFAWQAAESNSAPFAVLHVNDVCRWTWQLLLRGSFSKRSTGRRVKRVNGSTGHFHFHYIIYHSRRHQAHATPLQKAHGVNGSNGSMGHFHFHYIIYDSRRRQAHATPLQKTHGV